MTLEEILEHPGAAIADLDPDGEWVTLDSTRTANRWAIGPENSVWSCAECGRVIHAPEDGCEWCGHGTDDEESDA